MVYMQLLSVTHGYYAVCVVMCTYAGPQLVSYIFISEMYTHYVSEYKVHKCMCRSFSKSCCKCNEACIELLFAFWRPMHYKGFMYA